MTRESKGRRSRPVAGAKSDVNWEHLDEKRERLLSQSENIVAQGAVEQGAHTDCSSGGAY